MTFEVSSKKSEKKSRENSHKEKLYFLITVEDTLTSEGLSLFMCYEFSRIHAYIHIMCKYVIYMILHVNVNVCKLFITIYVPVDSKRDKTSVTSKKGNCLFYVRIHR